VIDMYADFSRAAKAGSMHQIYVELESDVSTGKESVGVPTKGRVIQIVK